MTFADFLTVFVRTRPIVETCGVEERSSGIRAKLVVNFAISRVHGAISENRSSAVAAEHQKVHQYQADRNIHPPTRSLHRRCYFFDGLMFVASP